MEKKREVFGISPYVTVQKLLSGKWSLLILYQLSEGPVRFNELQRRLPNLTQSTLSKQLKLLESENLILRREYPQVPPKVEYSLSEIGIKFKNVLKEIEIWGKEYNKYINEKNVI